MSLQLERDLNDNDVLFRFISEHELDALVERKSLLRFTPTRMQTNQEEGFAFDSQVQREKDKSLFDTEECVKNDIDAIAAYIEENEDNLQVRINKINKQAIAKGDNECPGRKLIKELCSTLGIETEKEILLKWDDADYGIILDVVELREKIEDLPCRANIMHDSDIQYVENVCLNSSSLCCFWIKPNHIFSRIQWSVRKKKVAAIKITVKKLKEYLKEINVKKYDADKVFYLCKVKYDDAPKYMYNENDFEMPLEMALLGFVRPDKETISEMLKNLKYKKRNYRKEKEMRVIAIRKDLGPIIDENIFLPFFRGFCNEMFVSPKLSPSRQDEIISKIHNIDKSILVKKTFFNKVRDMCSSIFRRKKKDKSASLT